MIDYYSKIIELLKENKPLIQVTVIDKVGSIPASITSKMLVSKKGFEYGTIGGGALEQKAVNYALETFGDLNKLNEIIEWDLHKDIGMACGGKIKLLFEVINPNNLNIVIFGAGHVCNALTKILITLNCSITCIDFRQEMLDKLPDSYKIKPLLSENMPEFVEKIPQKSFVLIMTPSHEMDWDVLKECLKRDFAYLGLMGSKSKIKWLKEKINEEGFPENFINKLHCPIGLSIGTNHPSEIAISITSHILQERDKQITLCL